MRSAFCSDLLDPGAPPPRTNRLLRNRDADRKLLIPRTTDRKLCDLYGLAGQRANFCLTTAAL